MVATLHTIPPSDDPTAASVGWLPRWWMTLGATSVVAGGLMAAVTGPLALSKGSWLAAYLVLVCGVPQYLMGRVTAHRGVVRAGWLLLVSWNVGNVAVLAGTLLAVRWLVDAGGVFLLAPLIVVLRALLHRQPPGDVVGLSGLWRWLLIVFLFALVISVPIGLVLGHVRAG